MKKYVSLFALLVAVAPFCIAASLQPYLINPTTNIEVYQNEFFNFSTGVRCIAGYCGNVTVTLDPIVEKTIAKPIKEAAKVEQSLMEKLQKENLVNVIVILEEDNQTAKGAVSGDRTAKLSKIKRQAINQQNNILSKLEAEPEFDLKYRYSTISGFAGKITKKTLEKLKQDPNVKAVYEDKILHISLQESVPLINADDVWDLGVIGNGSVVCVLDTGIDYNHPDLGGCFGPGCKVIDGYDFIHEDSEPMDDESHGTHVAGIIAANGVVKGVAPYAKLLAIKVCNSAGECLYSDIIAGMDWCNNHSDEYNIVAATMSIGDEGQYNKDNCPTTMDYSIDIAHNLGIFISAASGNEGYSNGISYPACSPHVVSVGSTTKSGVISSFTNTGELLDVLAPGSNIYSTLPGNGHGEKSGTSMATPHIAGAVALLKQHAPLASPDEIEDALKKTGVPVIDPDNGIEFPLVDILEAMDELTIKGTIPMNNGTPFYTLNENPTTCYDIKEGDSCNNTWTVNATGKAINYHFFTKYASNIGNITENITPSIDVRIVPVCIDNDGDSFNQSNFGCGIADCDDNDASIHPLKDLTEIKQNTKLCPGHYNLPNGLIINASNIVLDCNGAVLDGRYRIDHYNYNTGILSIKPNNTIKNCTIKNYHDGISIVQNDQIISNKVFSIGNEAIRAYKSDNCTIMNSEIFNNYKNIMVYYSSYCKIENNRMHGDGAYGGVYLHKSSKNSIINNTIYSSSIYLFESTENNVGNNSIYQQGGIVDKSGNFNNFSNNYLNQSSLALDGSYYDTLLGNIVENGSFSIDTPYQDIDTSNKVDGKPVYWWINHHNEKVPENASVVALIESSNIIVENLNLSNDYAGVFIHKTTNSQLRNLSIFKNKYGIYITYSYNNTITNSEISSNSESAIRLVYSYNNSIINNTIKHNNDDGIYSDDSRYTVIRNNKIYSNGHCGIQIFDTSGNIIEDNKIYSTKWNGIYLRGLNNQIYNNTVYSSNGTGIYLSSSLTNVLKNNTLFSNKYNLEIDYPYESSIDESNTINGKPVYYWVGQKDKNIPANAGYVALINCNNISVENPTLENEYIGLILYQTSNSKIKGLNISNCYYGIQSYYSNNNEIENTNIFNNYYGFYLVYSNNNTIKLNNIRSNEDICLYISDSSNNTITKNRIYNNQRGIVYSQYSKLPYNNFIQYNSILDNREYNFGNYAPLNISVENNWWGCMDEPCVKQGIYIYDFGYPTYVDYNPWLYGPFDGNQVPYMGDMLCQSNDSWNDCNMLKYAEILTKIKVNCTDRDGIITKASFELKNLLNQQIILIGNGTFDSGYWVYDNNDLLLDYDGLILSAKCVDNSSGENTLSQKWILGKNLLFYEGFESIESIINNNGTLYNNPEIVKGVTGNGINFTGNKKACYPIPGNFNETNGTIEFWVKVPPGNSYGFFDIGYLGDPNSWGIFKNADYLIMEVKNYANSFDQAWSLNSWVYDGKWHFVAAVWEKDGNNCTHFKVFLDGQGKPDYDGLKCNSFPNMTKNFCFGWCGWYGYSDSLMDEVKIYNYVKSDEEIEQDYLSMVNYTKENITRKECIMYKPESKCPVKINCSGLYVNNEPFTVKGVGYQPIPIGKTAESLQDKQEMYNNQNITKRDFKLLRKMNANTIRTWGEVMNKTFLDAAWNNGIDPIYVIMGFWINCDENYGDAAIRQKYINNFSKYVTEYKDHPAVLAWGLGNENNLGYCSSSGYIDDFYSLSNELARVAYEIEGENYHPVGVINGDIFNIGLEYYKADDLSMNYTDFWGSNIYPGKTFGSRFEDYAAMTGKPLIVTEYGIDALNNSNYKEYEDVHAEWVLRQWKEINASNVTIGSTLMAYSDEWWKAGSPSYHGYGGYSTPNHPDGYSNEEWWGVMRTEKNTSGGIDIMQPRKVYYALQSAWEEKTAINISLKKGWNLISLPLIASNMSVSSVFGKSVPIYAYNNSWFVPDKIDNKLGYWVKANQSVNLTVFGTESNDNIELNTGWNLVGYPSLEEANIPSVWGNLNITIYSYNGSWSSYVSNRASNSLKTLKPEYGYWVRK